MQATNYINAVLDIVRQHSLVFAQDGMPFYINESQYTQDYREELTREEFGSDEATLAYILAHAAMHGWECITYIDVDAGEAILGNILVLSNDDGTTHKVYYNVICPDITPEPLQG